MARKYVEDQVEAYLKANWTACEIRTENNSLRAPASGEPFITLQFPYSRTIRWALNERYYREEGGIRLVLSIEKGEGTERLTTWGDQLADLFRDRRIGKVECQVPSAIAVDSGDYPEGPYILSAIVVPYTYNYVA
jgi:hypothetical protein